MEGTWMRACSRGKGREGKGRVAGRRFPEERMFDVEGGGFWRKEVR